MRAGIFELYLAGSDDVSFEERQVGDAYYVCALPGTEYKVAAVIHKDANEQFPSVMGYRFVLSIDGTRVTSRVLDLRQYWFSDLAATVFSGFPSGPDSCEAFVFSAPQIELSKTASEKKSSRGLISVSVYEAEETDDFHEPSNATPVKTHPVPSTPLQLVEDKKFWQQPSLETARGKRIVFSPAGLKAKAGPTKQRIWKNLRTAPDAKLTLNYHMPDVLNFIGEHVISASPGNLPLPTSGTVGGHAPPKPWEPIIARIPDTPRTPIFVDLTEDGDTDDDKTVLEAGHKRARLTPPASCEHKQKKATTSAAVLADIVSL